MPPQDPFERLTILERAQFLSDSASRRHAEALDRHQATLDAHEAAHVDPPSVWPIWRRS